MPTKIEGGCSAIDPSLAHLLMVGRSPERLAPARLPGWLETLGVLGALAELFAEWQEHAAVLSTEARAHGFEPVASRWFHKDGRLRGDWNGGVPRDVDSARDRWSRAFCARLKY